MGEEEEGEKRSRGTHLADHGGGASMSDHRQGDLAEASHRHLGDLGGLSRVWRLWLRVPHPNTLPPGQADPRPTECRAASLPGWPA